MQVLNCHLRDLDWSGTSAAVMMGATVVYDDAHLPLRPVRWFAKRSEATTLHAKHAIARLHTSKELNLRIVSEYVSRIRGVRHDLVGDCRHLVEY